MRRKDRMTKWIAGIAAAGMMFSMIPALPAAAEDVTSGDAVVEETEKKTEAGVTVVAEKKTEAGVTVKAEKTAEVGTVDEISDTKEQTSEAAQAAKENLTENAQADTQSMTDITGGNHTTVKTEVRVNITPVYDEHTIDVVNGTATVNGKWDDFEIPVDESHSIPVKAAYDQATDTTLLTVDISGIPQGEQQKDYYSDYKEADSKYQLTYTGSKLTYVKTEYEDGDVWIGDPDDMPTENPGKVTIYEIRDDYYTATHYMERIHVVIPAAESKEPEQPKADPTENTDTKPETPATKTPEVKAKETAKATATVSNKKTAVKTGDESSFGWLTVLMTLSGSGVITVEMMRRKKEK